MSNVDNSDSDRDPKTGRFRKGGSRRRGRPRGAKNRKTILIEIANERHTFIEGGNARRRTTLDLLLLSLRNAAVAGNIRAVHAYEDYLRRYDAIGDGKKYGLLVVPEGTTLETTPLQIENVDDDPVTSGLGAPPLTNSRD